MHQSASFKQANQTALSSDVDLNIVCSFARMRDLLKLPKDVLPAVLPSKVPSETLSAVADLLRSSSIVEVNESGLRIRRKVGVID